MYGRSSNDKSNGYSAQLSSSAGDGIVSEMRDVIKEPWLTAVEAELSFEQALELNWCSWVLTHSAASESCVFTSELDHSRVVTGLPDGFLNWVAWSDVPIAAMDQRIKEISDEIYRDVPRGPKKCEWAVLGTQRNREALIEALERAGWELFYEVPGMTCEFRDGAQNQLGQHVDIRVVRTESDVDSFLRPFMEGFGIHPDSRQHISACFSRIAADPAHPFQHFTLYRSGKPITSGSIKYRYGQAVIYNIATVVEARGEGGATEMVRFLKDEVYKRGCQQVSLFAMPEGRRIYEKRGFQPNAASYAVYAKTLS